MKKSEFKVLLDEALKPFNEQIASLEQKFSIVSDKQGKVIKLATGSLENTRGGVNNQPERKPNY